MAAISQATFESPLQALGSPVRDDIDARRMLQCALGVFQKWPEGFA